MKKELHQEAQENMKIRIITILSLFLLLITSCSNSLDENAKAVNFSYILSLNGFEELQYEIMYSELLTKDLTPFQRADTNLVLGRIAKSNDNMIYALDYYHKASETNDLYEKALHYETIASIKKSSYYYARVAYIWRKLGNEKRFKINFDLATGKEPTLEFETSEIQPEKVKLENKPTKIILGTTSTKITKEDIVVSQTDRVTRDWLSGQIQEPSSNNLLTVFSEKLYYPEEELRSDIGWHEGARLKELINAVGFKHIKAYGTLIAKKDGKWYAENEEGIFMFEVPNDKIFYPTTRFLSENLAMVIDTHGINMLVRQAIENNATAVIGCCDHPGKIKAVKYLSDRGIKAICNTDKYLPLLIGSGANVLGSAPFSLTEDSLLFGFRPLEISLDEPIIVLDTSSGEHGMSYYDTPARYFSALEKAGIKLNTFVVEIDGFNQLDKVIKKAKSQNANIIAVRIFNSDDYNKVKIWLEQSPKHKAILFHSESYPYGYKLAREFKNQTTFDDINPVFI